MEIDESEILDPEYYNEQKALACLLADDVCFLNVANIGSGEKPYLTTTIFVIANDVFAWGCADAEGITNSDGEADSEIIALYRYWKDNQKWGSTKWLCLKRNEQPQKPIKDMMMAEGYWDDTLENLPNNNYDMRCREYNETKQK